MADQVLNDSDYNFRYCVPQDILIPRDRSILNSLLHVADRWTTLSFELAVDISFNKAERRLSDIWEPLRLHRRLHSLRSLTIRWPSYPYPYPGDPPSNHHLFLQAPELQSLDTLAFHRNLISPHSQLQRLVIARPLSYLSDAIWLFGHCTGLKDIELASDFERLDADTVLSPPITCLELQSLKLKYRLRDRRDAPELLSLLTLPSLTTLDLSSTNYIEGNIPALLLSFFHDLRNLLQRSACRLSTFCV
jgi:hypothetical protein